MSGPYRVLTEAELKELEAQQREREEQIRLRSEQHLLVQKGYQICDSIKRTVSTCKPTYKILDTMPTRLESSELRTTLQNELDKINQELVRWSRVVASLNAKDSASIKRENDELRACFGSISSVLNTVTVKVDRLKHQARALQIQHFDELLKACETNLEPKSKSCKKQKQVDSKTITIEKERFDAELNRITSQIQMLHSRAKEIHYVIAPLEEATTMVNALAQNSTVNSDILAELHRIDIYKLQTYEDELSKREKELDQLDKKLSSELAEYHVLCEETRTQPKSFPFSSESIECIRAECSQLLELHEWMMKRTFTLDKLRAYLTGKGYRYIGEKEEAPMLVRQAYHIGDQMAIHVVYDSECRMTIEIVKIDTVDRAPHPRERETIASKQLASCKEIEDMFDALNACGLHIQTDYAYHGGACFAKVVNISEFAGGDPSELKEQIYQSYQTRTQKYMYLEA